MFGKILGNLFSPPPLESKAAKFCLSLVNRTRINAGHGISKPLPAVYANNSEFIGSLLRLVDFMVHRFGESTPTRESLRQLVIALVSIRLHFKLLFKLAVVLLLSNSVVTQATMVRLHTVLGPVDIELFDTSAPLTVANFLSYVSSGAYSNSFIHRSVPGFVIQGGGYTWEIATSSVTRIPAGPPVVNEFSASRSNVRGTVAMAKVADDPNSATTEWFVNLADNSANLDVQNGGFTVFGKVTASSMVIVDAIAALPRVNAGGAFTNLPVTSVPSSGPLQQENLVMVSSVSVFAPISETSDSDRLFNYLEATYPQYLAPANSVSVTAFGYYYRYYPGTNAYVGTSNRMVYYLVPSISPDITPLGTLADWIVTAASAGY